VVLDALPDVAEPDPDVLPPSDTPYSGLDLVLQPMSEQATSRAKRNEVIGAGTHRGPPSRRPASKIRIRPPSADLEEPKV
jgi:hypothetical protein